LRVVGGSTSAATTGGTIAAIPITGIAGIIAIGTPSIARVR